MPAWQKDIIVILFILTYWVMAVGRFRFFKWLNLGRATFAMLCALIVLLIGSLSPTEIISALNLPTLLILLALMLISAIFYCSGFYAYSAMKVAQLKIHPPRLLFFVIAVSAFLSAWFANDIIAFAMTPILCRSLYRRGMEARPYLYGLMGGCNAGSLATMIGSPQNIIIAQHGHLPFWHFIGVCAPIAVVSVVIIYLVMRWVWRKQLIDGSRFESEILPPVERGAFFIGFILLLLFVTGLTLPIPRWITALVICVLVFVLFWFHWSEIFRRVDWRLLGLFVGLFLMNHAFANTGIPQQLAEMLHRYHLHMHNLSVLTAYAFLSANTVGKVPGALLFLTLWPKSSAHLLYALTIMMTLAGNTLLFSSFANIIVAERSSVPIRFIDHLKAGIPGTLISMAVALAYLWFFIFRP